MSSTEQDAASGEITQVIQNTDGAFPYPVLPGPCGIRNPYLLPLPSEAITETEVQINRIEAETDGLETAFEFTVKWLKARHVAPIWPPHWKWRRLEEKS